MAADHAALLAMTAVRYFTHLSPEFVTRHVRDHKRALGPAFSSAELFTGKFVCSDGRIDYLVFEKPTGAVLTYAHATRGEALAEARLTIAMLDGSLAEVLAQFRRSATAASETTELIGRLRAHKPRKVGKRARAVFESSDGKCHYCATVLTLDGRWHIEHKLPRALFGTSEQSNLVAACAPCNHAKRDKTDIEFIALIASKKAKNMAPS